MAPRGGGQKALHVRLLVGGRRQRPGWRRFADLRDELLEPGREGDLSERVTPSAVFA
jgi:hypothetical protein